LEFQQFWGKTCLNGAKSGCLNPQIGVAENKLLVFVCSLAFPKNAHAQVCWAMRTINQWACIETTSCPLNNIVKFCRGDSSIMCEVAGVTIDDCNTVYGNFGPCDILGCTGWTTAATCNQTGEFAVSCSAPPSCSWSGT